MEEDGQDVPDSRDPLDRLRDGLRWERAYRSMLLEWLEHTDHEAWLGVKAEKLFGQLDGLMAAWKELDHVAFGEYSRRQGVTDLTETV